MRVIRAIPVRLEMSIASERTPTISKNVFHGVTAVAFVGVTAGPTELACMGPMARACTGVMAGAHGV